MSTSTNQSSSVGSIVVAVMFVLVGIITLYDTLSYSDVDSKVFPRAAAVLLIVASTFSIFHSLLKPGDDEGFGIGSWWRRVLLVASMLVACAVMPTLGFIAASSIAFAGSLIAAMHDKWRFRIAAIYLFSGAVVVSGFYSLFKFGLNVPLP